MTNFEMVVRVAVSYVQWGSEKEGGEDGFAFIIIAILLFALLLVGAAALQGRTVDAVLGDWGL